MSAHASRPLLPFLSGARLPPKWQYVGLNGVSGTNVQNVALALDQAGNPWVASNELVSCSRQLGRKGTSQQGAAGRTPGNGARLRGLWFECCCLALPSPQVSSVVGFADVVRRYDPASASWQPLPAMDTHWGASPASSLQLELDTSTSPPTAYLATSNQAVNTRAAVAVLEPGASAWTWLRRDR